MKFKTEQKTNCRKKKKETEKRKEITLTRIDIALLYCTELVKFINSTVVINYKREPFSSLS